MKIRLRHQQATKAFTELLWGEYFTPPWGRDFGKVYQKLGDMDERVYVVCVNTGEILPSWNYDGSVYELKPVEITDDGTMIFEPV